LDFVPHQALESDVFVHALYVTPLYVKGNTQQSPSVVLISQARDNKWGILDVLLEFLDANVRVSSYLIFAHAQLIAV
jgi:hypothetical protein